VIDLPPVESGIYHLAMCLVLVGWLLRAMLDRE
jgi:hypothetical protein